MAVATLTAALPAAPAEETRLMRAPQGAAYITVGLTKFWGLVYAGEIPRVQIGRSVRFRKEDLDAFIARNVVGGEGDR